MAPIDIFLRTLPPGSQPSLLFHSSTSPPISNFFNRHIPISLGHFISPPPPSPSLLPKDEYKKRSSTLSSTHLLSPQRSKRPLLVFLSARRKAFEKSASRTERSSIWTLTLEFRSRSASSRRRTGATPPKQPPRLTSRERSTYQQDSSASDGRKTTPLSQPIFLLAATDSARKTSKSLAKRIVTTVRAAEKTSTSVKIAGQSVFVLFAALPIAFLRLQSHLSNH